MWKNPGTGEAEYIEWVEGLTKTRQGGLCKKDRRVPQRMFAVGGDRCPVRLMEKLISKRPATKKMSGPLYLTPLQHFEGKDMWYTLSPVGLNQIDHFMKTMTKLAGLETIQKNFTNHSVRKMLVRKLQKSGISNDKIASITGHSSEQSLRYYADTDIADHAKMSKILSLQSHPSQPPQQKQHVNTHAHPDPVSCLQPSYPVPFFHCHSSILLVFPHPNMYLMIVIFILVVAPAHVHNFMILMQPFIENITVHS